MYPQEKLYFSPPIVNCSNAPTSATVMSTPGNWFGQTERGRGGGSVQGENLGLIDPQ